MDYYYLCRWMHPAPERGRSPNGGAGWLKSKKISQKEVYNMAKLKLEKDGLTCAKTIHKPSYKIYLCNLKADGIYSLIVYKYYKYRLA